MKERLRIENISMGIDISDSFPMLHGNHIKLEQVFLNLLQNSLDAMEEQGSGEINLSAAISLLPNLLTQLRTRSIRLAATARTSGKP